MCPSRPLTARRPRPGALLALLVALPLLLGACGGDPPGPRLALDGVHDLYALYGTAEVTSGGLTEHPPLLLFRLVYLDNKVDDRDRIASLHAPAPTTMTWRGLETRGPARLSFGTGHLRKEVMDRESPVTFVVEGLDEAAGETEYTTLFDRTLAPAELGDRPWLLRHELELPARELARWTLRFRTEAPGVPAVTAAWATWFGPVLRSTPREVAGEDHPVRQQVVAKDLVADLAEAEVLEEVADDPVQASAFDAAFEVPVLGGRRSLVAATAPSRVRWQLEVPEGGVLDFAVGMDTERGWQKPGDGMTFAVEVDGERVWSLRIDPHHVVNDRGWQLADVDLSPWAGRTVQLDLVTEPGDDASNDVGGWASLRLLSRRSSRRLARGERPNVILVVMDTLRADRFGCYGNPNDLTPRMDAVAARGLVFSDARTVASYTWPSTASIFTGLYPHAHGVLGNGQAWLVDRAETLAELFSDAGYTTGAFVANPLIGPPGNFQQGFETFVNAPAIRARALNERVGHWLTGREEAALFTYVHYFDVHNPYNAPPGFEPEELRPGYSQRDVASPPHLARAFPDEAWDEQQLANFNLENNGNFRDYDGEVLYQDTALGELLDDFAARGLLEDAVVILMSDHGEEFYEHGYPFHGPNLYDESLRVPLILTGYGPSAVEPGVVERPVHVTDILPTLCEMTGVPTPEADLHGHSLLGRGGDEPHYFLSMNGEEVGVEGMTEKLSVLLPPWKLVETPVSERVELYKLDDDPGELNDLAELEPDIRDRLRDRLEAWLTDALEEGAADTGISPEQAWWLQQLGYMGGEDGDR